MENNPISRSRFSPLFRWGLLLLLFVLAVLFFQSSLTSSEKPIQRWFVFLIPFVSDRVVSESNGGSLLYLFLSIIFDILFFGVSYLLGRGIFHILERFCDLRKRLDFGETLFFYTASGLATLCLLGALVAFFYQKALCRFGIVLFFAGLLLFVLFSLGRLLLRIDWKSVPNRFCSFPQTVRSMFKERITPFSLVGFLLILPFALFLFLRGMAPSIEYDFLEYHAQAGREILEKGTIPFFSHNAYMNMPLGTEMIYYWGDLLWSHLPFLQERFSPEVSIVFLGTCSAKGVVALIAVLTALGVFLFVRRFFSQGDLRQTNRMAVAAVLIYLAFPGSYSVFICGLNDGVLGFAILGALYSLLLSISANSFRERISWSFVSGLLTGFAVSIKYTAIPFVAIPFFLGFALFLFCSQTKGSPFPSKRFSRAVPLVVFFFTAVLFGGFWYVKNLCYTGNPFWPLAYSLFGDSTSTWSPVIAERWRSAHSASWGNIVLIFHTLLGEFTASAMIVFLPLLFLVVRTGKGENLRVGRILLLYFLLFVALWVGVTHRLTRFLDPILPVFALLMAFGFSRLYESFRAKFPRVLLATLLFLGGVYALCLDTTLALPLGGGWQNATSYRLLYGDAPAFFAQKGTLLGGEKKESRPLKEGKLLLLGEARAFAYQNGSILYSTCWNRSPLIHFLPDSYRDRVLTSGDFQWTESERTEFQKRLADENVAMILVDWREIQRFLSRGNYGLTDAPFFTPQWFQSMEKNGLVRRYFPDPTFQWKEKEVELWRVVPPPAER